MRIYTRGGDKGKTSLFDGTRVAKTDLRVEAYGTVDELNALLSLARVGGPPEEVVAFLDRVQNELFTLGADLATPEGSAKEAKRVTQAMSARLEKDIDAFMDKVGNPGGFVLPGDSEQAARLHVCRTVCRRAERVAAQLGANVSLDALRYLNRLSDALYAAAVYTDKVAGGRDLRNPTY
jgi:cob(I)alamin adenosyltransferase